MNVANPKRFYSVVGIVVAIIVVAGLFLLLGKDDTVTKNTGEPVGIPQEVQAAIERTKASPAFNSVQTSNLAKTKIEYRSAGGRLAMFDKDKIVAWRDESSFFSKQGNCLAKNNAPAEFWPSSDSAVFAIPSSTGTFKQSKKGAKTIYTQQAKYDAKQPPYKVIITIQNGLLDSYVLTGNKLELRTDYTYDNVVVPDIDKLKC